MTDTQQQLIDVQLDIGRMARERPEAVMLAAIHVLIEVAAGDNPALRDYKKLQLYKGIRHTLAKQGIRPCPP